MPVRSLDTFTRLRSIDDPVVSAETYGRHLNRVAHHENWACPKCAEHSPYSDVYEHVLRDACGCTMSLPPLPNQRRLRR